MLSKGPPGNHRPGRAEEAAQAGDGSGAPSETAAVFEKREKAEAFVEALTREVDVEARVVERKSSIGTGLPAAAVFEIQVPPEQILAAETLYRLDLRGIPLDQLPALSRRERAQVLQDVLCSRARRSGGWAQNPCSPEELAWFQAAAQLSQAHARWALSQAREAFFSQHVDERKIARIMGLGCVAAGFALALVQGFSPLGPLILVATGTAFAIFSFVRREP